MLLLNNNSGFTLLDYILQWMAFGLSGNSGACVQFPARAAGRQGPETATLQKAADKTFASELIPRQESAMPIHAQVREKHK